MSMRPDRITRWSWIVAAVLVVACGPAWAGPGDKADVKTDWPHWRGPNGTGVSTESGWLADWPDPGPDKAWRASVGKGFSSVAVVGGRVYTLGNADGKDTVYCFDAAGGKEVWSFSYPCAAGRDYRGPRGTPAVDDGRVYTVSRAGQMLCLSADKGKRLWARDLSKLYKAKPGQWDFAGSPVILGKAVVVDLGVVIALNKKTGTLLWKTPLGTAGYSTPAVFKAGSKIYLATFPITGLAILDAANGKPTGLEFRWRTSYNVNAVTPIVSDGKVFLSSGYGAGCALVDISGKAARQVWRNKNMSNHMNSCVLYKGHLYGFNGNAGGGKLTCLEFKTGKVKWSQGGTGAGALMIAGGKLVVQCERGDVMIAEATPEEFKLIARTKKVLGGTCWTTPVLSGGRIYCRNDRGDLVCLNVSAK